MSNRRGFLKTLVTGGAAAAIGAKPATAVPEPKIVKVVERVVEPMPQNITGRELAFWLYVTECRRKNEWIENTKRKIAEDKKEAEYRARGE